MKQEEKAKRYDEALERAKGVIEQNPLMEYLKKGIEYILPELKESEDEKMRAMAIKAVYAPEAQSCIKSWGINPDDVIAWLEKQREQKQDPCDNCKDVMLNCHNFPCIKKRAFKQGKSVFDVINEEKVDNANKVEQKFKVGYWVTCKEIDTALIVNITDDKYEVEFIDGNKGFPHIDYVDRFFSLWTIQNAEDGDVLYSPTHHLIWIYKDNKHYYAFVNMNYVTENVATDGFISIPKDACPATKEQRNQLKKAMADAGYTFDFEKKELKKIVAPKFKIGDTMRTLQEAYNGITSGLPVVVSIDNEYYHCNNELIAIKNQDNYEYPPMNRRQKPSWIEEDENLLKASFENLTELKDMYGEEYCKVGDCISWLKSLKQRYTWKPSEEQLDALQYVYRNLNPPLSDKLGWNSLKTLELMYHDLKKLK